MRRYYSHHHSLCTFATEILNKLFGELAEMAAVIPRHVGEKSNRHALECEVRERVVTSAPFSFQPRRSRKSGTALDPD
jgi:hypothetical protein